MGRGRQYIQNFILQREASTVCMKESTVSSTDERGSMEYSCNPVECWVQSANNFRYCVLCTARTHVQYCSCPNRCVLLNQEMCIRIPSIWHLNNKLQTTSKFRCKFWTTDLEQRKFFAKIFIHFFNEISPLGTGGEHVVESPSMR